MALLETVDKDYVALMKSKLDTDYKDKMDQLQKQKDRIDTLESTVDYINSCFSDIKDEDLLTGSQVKSLLFPNGNVADDEEIEAMINAIDVDASVNNNDKFPIIQGMVMIHWLYCGKDTTSKLSFVKKIINKLLSCNHVWGSDLETKSNIDNMANILRNKNGSIQDVLSYFSISDLIIYGW